MISGPIVNDFEVIEEDPEDIEAQIRNVQWAIQEFGWVNYLASKRKQLRNNLQKAQVSYHGIYNHVGAKVSENRE